VPTLGDYRRRLAETAGWSLQLVETNTSALANQLVIADLQSAGGLESSFLGSTWAYQPSGPNAGQARRVGYNGLDPTTGTVTLDRSFGGTTPASTPVEFYGRLPPVSMEGRLGLNSIVNRVLNECWTLKKVDITATQDNQKFFPLNGAVPPVFPWLNAEDRVVDVYSRDAMATADASDQLMATWRWLSAADNPTLEVGRALRIGDLLRIFAIVPMAWWTLQASGTWGMPSSSGLVAEGDQALIDLNGMEIVGKPYVYDELAKWGLPDDQNVYRGLRDRARAAANQYKRLALERPVRRTLHWPSSLSVPSRWGYSYGSDWGMVTRG
jgi:hypothetical protein